MIEHINAIAAGSIAVWATWCCLSSRVRDGVVGKILYCAIALSGYAILARSNQLFFTPNAAGVTLHVALALAGARHVFMVTYWPAIRARLCARLDCEHCLRDQRFGPAGDQIERRSEGR